MSRPLGIVFLTLLSTITVACLRPASERARLDLSVGEGEGEGLRVLVEDRMASVRTLDAERVELWSQAPSLNVHVEHDDPGPRAVRLDVLNIARDVVLSVDEQSFPCTPLATRGAGCSFALELPPVADLHIEADDVADESTFVFAVLGDVQRGIGKVEDVFARMNEDPEIAFVVSGGDLVNTGERSELVRFQNELALLNVPYFSTVGNHELGGSPRPWHELFGPFNVHFRFKGVYFSLIDAGNATIDPTVYEWLDAWLEEARSATHVVCMHIPPLDPVGVRGGGFRSRKEGAKLMQKLAEGRVDTLFLGHIHSYYAYSAAGVPSFISGGGGAIPERFDGIGRHYLRVRASAARGIEDVAVVRVD